MTAALVMAIVAAAATQQLEKDNWKFARCWVGAGKANPLESFTRYIRVCLGRFAKNLPAACA